MGEEGHAQSDTAFVLIPLVWCSAPFCAPENYSSTPNKDSGTPYYILSDYIVPLNPDANNGGMACLQHHTTGSPNSGCKLKRSGSLLSLLSTRLATSAVSTIRSLSCSSVHVWLVQL